MWRVGNACVSAQAHPNPNGVLLPVILDVITLVSAVVFLARIAIGFQRMNDRCGVPRAARGAR